MIARPRCRAQALCRIESLGGHAVLAVSCQEWKLRRHELLPHCFQPVKVYVIFAYMAIYGGILIMRSFNDPRYSNLLQVLKEARQQLGMTQTQLATQLGSSWDQTEISRVEAGQRRLDVIEYADWAAALTCDPAELLAETLGSPAESADTAPALPIPNQARLESGQLLVSMRWRNRVIPVALSGITPAVYRKIESRLAALFVSLNAKEPELKNREAISQALAYAISTAPECNPSDLYHHVVYRLYLREFRKTQADRSWVRAGGEALEDFIVKHYTPILSTSGIRIVWLCSKALRRAALEEMGIHETTGSAKLDIAFYGKSAQGEQLFAGMHVKASLAERVSDDVPCSQAMIAKGFASYLFTLDVKSFPPPNGDLVNRGELGTAAQPSDKRLYVEKHGAFTACFSYNLRTSPTAPTARVASRIHVSSFKPQEDPLPKAVLAAWRKFQH